MRDGRTGEVSGDIVQVPKSPQPPDVWLSTGYLECPIALLKKGRPGIGIPVVLGFLGFPSDRLT